jgi:hypothetical protein
MWWGWYCGFTPFNRREPDNSSFGRSLVVQQAIEGIEHRPALSAANPAGTCPELLGGDAKDRLAA